MTLAAGATGGGVEVLVHPSGREVTVRGQLEVRTVPELRIALQGLLAAGEGDLVLHLGEAEIADATGLGVLVGLHHRARRLGRRLVIAEASDRLERLLRLTKLHLVLARVDGASSLGQGSHVVPPTMLPPVR